MRRTIVSLVAALILSACGGGDPVEVGIVIELDGDLNRITAFVLVNADGERFTFEPAPDVRFHDGAPLSHLADHLRAGTRIEVTYRQLEDGTLAALRVEDVGS